MPGIYYCHECKRAVEVLLYSEVRVGSPDGGGLVGPIGTTPMCPDCTIDVVRLAVRREFPETPASQTVNQRLHSVVDDALNHRGRFELSQDVVAVDPDGRVQFAHRFVIAWRTDRYVSPDTADLLRRVR